MGFRSLSHAETADSCTIGVAIAIPDPYGAELQSWRRSFGDPLADAIPSHITLLPPTQVACEQLDGIDEHLTAAAAASEPFGVHLRGSATFRPVSPVVFVALSRGISGCESLATAVRRGPLWRELSFPYHPHVTVAHHLPDEAMDRAYRKLADYEAEFVVKSFSVYEHGADGVWRPRREFLLGSSLPYEPMGG